MLSELNLIDKDKLNYYLNKPVINSVNKEVGKISWVG